MNDFSEWPDGWRMIRRLDEEKQGISGGVFEMQVPLGQWWNLEDTLQTFAVKRLTLTSETREKVLREIQVQTLPLLPPHPHVLELLQSIEWHGQQLLLFELATTDLLQWLNRIGMSSQQPLREKESRRIFSQMLRGVSHLHYHGIVHRDLKLENFLIMADGQIKVGDFGFALHVHPPGTLIKTKCGSPLYAAPEIWLYHEHLPASVDIFALGICLYTLNFGEQPFRCADQRELGRKILNMKRGPLHTHLKLPPRFSLLLTSLLELMLRYDSFSRPKLSLLLKFHPWLSVPRVRPRRSSSWSGDHPEK